MHVKCFTQCRTHSKCSEKGCLLFLCIGHENLPGSIYQKLSHCLLSLCEYRMPGAGSEPWCCPGTLRAEQSTQASGLDLVFTSARFLVCEKPSLKSRAVPSQTVAHEVCIFTEFSSHSLMPVHGLGPSPLSFLLSSSSSTSKLLGFTIFQRGR